MHESLSIKTSFDKTHNGYDISESLKIIKKEIRTNKNLKITCF